MSKPHLQTTDLFYDDCTQALRRFSVALVLLIDSLLCLFVGL